jgi:hypothetical protein
MSRIHLNDVTIDAGRVPTLQLSALHTPRITHSSNGDGCCGELAANWWPLVCWTVLHSRLNLL